MGMLQLITGFVRSPSHVRISDLRWASWFQ